MMKKFTSSIGIILFVFVAYFGVPSFVGAQTVDPVAADPAGSPTQDVNQNTAIETALGSCGFENMKMCGLSFLYNYILGPTTWLAGLGGKLFDYFISYSLDSNAYTSGFIEKGWAVIRDIANVAFIFTLLYLAIKHILGSGGIQKYLPTLIIVALLLNFSLFFTRVVIDAGNILARAFYSSIVIENDNYASEIGFKSLSVGLLSKINPQYLLSASLFEPKITTTYSTADPDNTNYGQTQSSQLIKGINENIGYYALIFILVAVVNLVLMWVFVSVALLFLGRIIGLWFSMIFSPIAFITLAVPNSSGFVKGMSFDQWQSQTLKLAFLAPIFIFFIYLTIMFMTVFFSTPIPTADQDTFMMILKVFIPFIFIITILMKGKSVAEDMAGEAGGMVKSMVGKALGFVGGMAFGVAGFAGRKVIGGVASSALKGGNYEKRIADAQAVGDRGKARRLMLAQKTLMKFNESSFDIRNAPKAKGVAGKFSGFVGSQLDQGAKAFGGSKMTFGKGVDQSRKKYEDTAEKEKLQRGEDLSTIRFSERGAAIETQKNIIEEEIKELKNNKNSIEEGFKTETKTISDRLEELNKKPIGFGGMSLDEKDEKIKLEKEFSEIEKNKKSKLDKVDKDIKSKEDVIKDDEKLIKKESGRRKDMYAKEVEQQNWYNFRTQGNASETASKIRKGDKVKSDADKMVELAEKLAKEKTKENEGEEPAPPPPTPPTTT